MRRLCHRRRQGPIGRPPKPVRIGFIPPIRRFDPFPPSGFPPVILEAAEIEALRLVDLEGLSFEEAGTRMNVSRNTVWRLAGNARRKIMCAIMEGRPIIIRPAGEPPPQQPPPPQP
ncbi:hypothetical protein DRO34_07325 [Candidatus Bathyarchaeota archaeon]|nr:MAG: hypothetical protein DRO34_07325 [Candidatus Bathyarchaeota archaeon]